MVATPFSEQPISAAQQIIASCTGSVITTFVVTPLDVIKIRMQAQARNIKPGSPFIYHNGLMDYVCLCTHCENNKDPVPNTCSKARCSTLTEPWFLRQQPKPFKGPLDAMVKISRSEGISSLWSGLPPTLLMSVPATVMYYTAYDQIKYALGFRDGHTDASKSLIPAAAGVMARTAVTVCVSPLELIRTKMQSERLSYSDLARAMRLSFQETGFLTLMKGLGPHLLRDVPFSAVYWIGYENLKALQMSRSKEPQNAPTFKQAFSSGAIAGTVAALATNPFDVIKTHRQIELGQMIESHKGNRVTSTWKLVQQLYQTSGIAGLYSGIKPRVLRVSLACAIMISSYEYMKTFFRNYNKGLYELSLGEPELDETVSPALSILQEKAQQLVHTTLSSAFPPSSDSQGHDTKDINNDGMPTT